jgi:hypothetical protein
MLPWKSWRPRQKRRQRQVVCENSSKDEKLGLCVRYSDIAGAEHMRSDCRGGPPRLVLGVLATSLITCFRIARPTWEVIITWCLALRAIPRLTVKTDAACSV